MKKDHYVLGIDVGGTTVKCGLFDYTGEMTKTWEIPTRKEDGGKNILPDIATSVKKSLAEEGIDLSAVEGAGVVVPGPVVHERFVPRCVNINWGPTEVADDLSALLEGIPVKAANDATAAAIGEHWKGGGRGYNSLMLFTLGTGVGGGIILDGKPWGGAHGTGGEVGHTTVKRGETVQCTCGRYGCLEQYASATGLVRTAKEMLKKSDVPSVLRRQEEKMNAKIIMDAAAAGDEIAIDARERMCKYLALAMGTMASTLDPECFVLGGGVSRAGEILIERIRYYYPRYTFGKPEEVEFRLATLGNDAGMVGAAKLVFGEA